MKRWIAAMLCALTLAACGQDGGSRAAPSADGNPDFPVGKPIEILALGDSLFAGYQLPQAQSYPAQLEAALRARGMNVRIHNAGVSGDTTGAARQRLNFVLDNLREPPRLALVELGANDMLRGLPPEEARRNLDAIMAEFDRRGIPMVVMGMRAAPNLGLDYMREFDGMYPDLAERYDAELVPLFIEPLLTDRSLVQRDQIHPTADGVSAMVEETVDTVADALDN